MDVKVKEPNAERRQAGENKLLLELGKSKPFNKLETKENPK